MRVEEYCGIGSKDTPKVGDKCTIHYYSDSEPCQVVRVSASGKTMWIKENLVEADPTKFNDVGHQNWIIHENKFESDREIKVTKRKDGKWRIVGNHTYVALGQWHKYYDWSF